MSAELPRASRALEAGAALALAASAFVAAPAARSLLEMGPRLCSEAAVDAGEALRHAAGPAGVDPTWRMPLGSLSEAYLAVHARAPRVWLATALLVFGALAAALGGLLGGTSGALLAAAWALLEWSRRPVGSGYIKMFLFSIFLLLAAAAAAWRARRATPGRSLALGAAVGAGLLHRSPLVFWPVVAILLDLRTRERRRTRRGAFLLLAAPLAFLLPWAWANARIHGHPTLLERGAANLNLVTAVSGLGAVGDGDQRLLMDAPNVDAADPGPALRWAAGRVVSDPGAYLAGCWRRLRYAVGLHPWLLAAALASILLRHRRPGALEAGSVAAYYLLIECSMSVNASYFEPLWPLIAALAGGLLAPAPVVEPAWAGRATLACAVAASLAGGAAASTSVLYAIRSSRAPVVSPQAAERALGGRSDDPWLLILRARHASWSDPAAALSDLDRAAARWSGKPRLRLERAWAWRRLGRRAALDELSFEAPDPLWPDDDVRLDLHAARAAAAAEDGARGRAGAELEAALSLWRSEQKVPEARTETDFAAQRLFRAGAERGFFFALKDSLALRGADAALARLAETVDPKAAPRLLHEFALYLQDRPAAGPRGALPLFERLAAAHPGSAVYLKDLGVCAYRAGRRALALASLRRAAALDPRSAEAAGSLEAVLNRPAPRS